MKKLTFILMICVVTFFASCGFYSTSEEQIVINDLFVEEEINEEYIVYRTRTGKKYHAYGCRYLSQSCIEITLEDAESSGLKPCNVCQP